MLDLFLRYTFGLILGLIAGPMLVWLDDVARKGPRPFRRLFWDLEWWAMLPKHVCELAALALAGAFMLCLVLIVVGLLKWLFGLFKK